MLGAPARLAALTLAASLTLPCWAVCEEPLRGVGAASARAAYDEWVRAYEAKTHIAVSYAVAPPASVLDDLKAGRADFGTSEVPLVLDQLVAKGLVQFPMLIAGVVPVVNVPGVVPGALKLTGPVLADIFLGKITNWDDPAIQTLNEFRDLPPRPIKVVHPGQASGSTYVFTTYLSSVSSDWQKRVGRGFSVNWPVGEEKPDAAAMGTYVLKTFGAIGFVDYARAADEGLAKAQLQNREGEFVSPNVVSFQAAADHAPWDKAPAFGLLLVNVQGSGSWPLTAPVFVVLPYAPKDPARALQVLRFFDWTFRDGSRLARDAGFVALPTNVTALVESAWKRQVKTAGGAPVWTGQ